MYEWSEFCIILCLNPRLIQTDTKAGDSGPRRGKKAAMDTQGHILVVDDDREIRMLVGDYLKKHGYRVSLAADSRQMREILAGSGIDLIVLDLMLPGEDSLSLCRDLRARSDLPVLMLTARTEPIDRVLGLEMGADDYLAKPFEPRELLARIRNILRRVQSLPAQGLTAPVHRWRFAGWILDRQTHQLTSPQGVVVALSGAEYRLLQVFLTHPNRVLTCDQLMDLTRGREADPFDRSIDLRVSRLRQKLGDNARAPSLIKTLRNEGYMLAAAVEQER
jgi:two-component system, OmpR family, response regulator